jgi:hypothetical protein
MEVFRRLFFSVVSFPEGIMGTQKGDLKMAIDWVEEFESCALLNKWSWVIVANPRVFVRDWEA